MDNDDVITVVVDGRTIETLRRPLAAGDVLALAGMPDGIVIRVDGGRPSHFAPDEAVEFGSTAKPTFRTFHSGIVRQLRVDGLLWDWGSPAITEDEVRMIAGISDDHALHVHGNAEPIRAGGAIDLTGTWPPQIELRKVRPLSEFADELVPVTVNGRSITLDRSEVTFEDLVRAAFPGADTASPSSRALTVTYRHGPPARPEGSLVSRQKVQVRKGEIFNVTATDKS